MHGKNGAQSRSLLLRETKMLFVKCLMAVDACHFALLIVHPIPAVPHVCHTVADQAGLIFFLKWVVPGLISTLCVGVEHRHHLKHRLSGHLGTAIFFFLGGHRGTGGQGPLGNGNMAKRGFCVPPHLIGKMADVVKSLRGKVGAAVPLKQFIDHFNVGFLLVIGNHSEILGGDTQRTAKGPLAPVAGRQMTIHMVRHGRPGITHRFL